MTDVINLYPKTSCQCWNCQKEYKVPTTGIKSNLSLRGCQTPEYFDCYNTVEINANEQPRNAQGWVTLNPQAYNNKIAQGFHHPKMQGRTSADINDCQNNGWVSEDPREFDTLRYQTMVLDRPPTDGDVRLKHIYDEKYDNYGKLQTGGFSSYEEIDDGDVTYYLDKSIEDAFYEPVFSEKAKATTTLYQNPMSAVSPQHERTAIINTENPTVVKRGNYPYCLSWMQDSQSYREDLMSWQQRRHNETKWSARWPAN